MFLDQHGERGTVAARGALRQCKVFVTAAMHADGPVQG
jgi:hypothetical protein